MYDKSLPHVNVGTIGHCDHVVVVDHYTPPFKLVAHTNVPAAFLDEPISGHGKRGKKGKAKKDWM